MITPTKAEKVVYIAVMKRCLLSLYLLIACLSCNRPNVVYILPLGQIPAADITVIKRAVEDFYHHRCIVKPAAARSDDILADSKTRYDANRILSKYNTGDNTLILTGHDIAMVNPQRHVREWGIFGLGDQPGTTCVVSTFRLKQNATSDLFHNRLIKVCLHELGHNWGLPHCTSGDTRCLMNDAHGTIKEIDRGQVFLCAQCRQCLCDEGGICKVN